MRFNLGPQGSLWQFDLIYATGPSFGDVSGYLATVPEDAVSSGTADQTNLLQAIDDSEGGISYLNVFRVTAYSAVLTPNVKRSVGAGLLLAGTTQFRIGGAPGNPLTGFTLDPILNVAVGDGGPGIYALQLALNTKQGASTGYDARLQAVAAHRTDWAWG